MTILQGKKGLVTGVANENSIATGCARAFKAAGAELIFSYGYDKTRGYIEPIAQELDAELLQIDVQAEGQMESAFEHISNKWGSLDFVIHSMASTTKEALHSRLVDCSAKDFALTMDITVHSLIRFAKLAEPLMSKGGCLLTMSYYGAEKVIPNYNVMGPAKAALEAVTRQLAVDLGNKDIRVNAISPGPIMTRAASGIIKFDQLIEQAQQRAPGNKLATTKSVGDLATFLVSDAAAAMTGDTFYVDAGFHITG